MARKPAAVSPLKQAITGLASLSAAGTSPDRMARAARQAVATWREMADSDIALRWAKQLHADLTAGLASAEEQEGDVDSTDAGTVKQGRAIVEGLRAAVANEMGRTWAPTDRAKRLLFLTGQRSAPAYPAHMYAERSNSSSRIRPVLALTLCLAISLVAQGASATDLTRKHSRERDAYYRKVASLYDKLKIDPVPSQHPCSDPRMVDVFDLLMVSYMGSGIFNRSQEVFEQSNLAELFLAVARREGELGCIASQRSTYLRILTTFPGPAFAGFRQRAQVGLDDIRAIYAGRSVDEVPWPIGHKRITAPATQARVSAEAK